MSALQIFYKLSTHKKTEQMITGMVKTDRGKTFGRREWSQIGCNVKMSMVILFNESPFQFYGLSKIGNCLNTIIKVADIKYWTLFPIVTYFVYLWTRIYGWKPSFQSTSSVMAMYKKDFYHNNISKQNIANHNMTSKISPTNRIIFDEIVSMWRDAPHLLCITYILH